MEPWCIEIVIIPHTIYDVVSIGPRMKSEERLLRIQTYTWAIYNM